MAQQTPESPATSRRSNTASGVAVITAALMVGLAPFATSRAALAAGTPEPDDGRRVDRAGLDRVPGTRSAMDA